MNEDQIDFMTTFFTLFLRIVEARNRGEGLVLDSTEIEQLFFCLDTFMGEE